MKRKVKFDQLKRKKIYLMLLFNWLKSGRKRKREGKLGQRCFLFCSSSKYIYTVTEFVELRRMDLNKKMKRLKENEMTKKDEEKIKKKNFFM